MQSAQSILQTMRQLASTRPIFHSEADFQHAIAWSVQQSDPAAIIRLEVPFRYNNSSEYLDLHISSGDQSLAVELKYKTRRLSHSIAGEEFSLKQQGAQDIGRYDYLADVARLERFVTEKKATAGCAILITNDSSYWSPPTRQSPVDQMFRLNEGRILSGSLSWLKHASPGTMRSREMPVVLTGRYVAYWKPYSVIDSISGAEFRYLALHVQ